MIVIIDLLEKVMKLWKKKIVKKDCGYRVITKDNHM